MSSLSKAIRELEQFRDDFLDGAFPQRSALGPGSLSSSFLKSKSITSSMIDVSELAAVSANTGNLTVSGTITLSSATSKIIDADGSYWDNTGIVLVSTGIYGDAIKWTVGGVDAGTITADATDLTMAQGSLAAVGATLSLGTTNWVLASIGGANLQSSGNDIKAVANFYPGLASLGTQSANYLNTDGSYMAVRGAGLKVYGDLLSTASIAGSNIYPGGQTTRYFSDNGSVLTTSSGLTVSGTLTATALSGPLTGNVTGSVTGNVTGNISGTSVAASGIISAGYVTCTNLVQGGTVTSLGLMTANTFRLDSTSGGGTNVDVAVPVNTGLDVVLSTDNGATLLFVPLRWVTMNIGGTNKKVLTFNE